MRCDLRSDDADAQSRERTAQFFRVCFGRLVERRTIALVVTSDDFHQQSQVFGMMRERADLIKAARERDQTVAADASVGWFEPQHAAKCSRLSHRSAGVRTDRQRRHTSRQTGGRTAAAATGSPPAIPWVFAWSEDARLGA